jgi:hypothetical protein
MGDTIEAAVSSTMALPSASRAPETSSPSSASQSAAGAESRSADACTATHGDGEIRGAGERDIGGYHLVFEFSGPDRFLS